MPAGPLLHVDLLVVHHIEIFVYYHVHAPAVVIALLVWQPSRRCILARRHGAGVAPRAH